MFICTNSWAAAAVAATAAAAAATAPMLQLLDNWITTSTL
jgi:hypothetical protein